MELKTSLGTVKLATRALLLPTNCQHLVGPLTLAQAHSLGLDVLLENLPFPVVFVLE